MQTKPLLYGLIGFFLGGLLVSLAATYLDENSSRPQTAAVTSPSMSEMVHGLRGKTGDEFDKAFLTGMIAHHEGAVDMAELSEANAKHPEIKQLSQAILAAQKAEIKDMRRWQADWGYTNGSSPEHDPAH